MQHQAIPVPVFNGENYDFWSIKMMTYFKSQDLWENVKYGVYEFSRTERLRKDARALFTIQQALTDEVFPSIYDATNTKQAWDILRVEFRGAQAARSTKLRFYLGEFDRGLRMEGSEICREYYLGLRLMVSRNRYYGGVVRDEAVVRKLLEGLPEEFEPIVSAMGAAGHLTISAPELIGSLEAFEMRLGLRGGRGEGLGSEVNDSELQ